MLNKRAKSKISMQMFEWVIRKDIGGRKEQQDNACVFTYDGKIFLAAVAWF